MHAEKILRRRELAGRVAGEGERQVVRQDAAAVVHDADQLDAALFDVDVDPAAAGIHRIFQQLLDDAGRPFDNLPRGDLSDDRRRQLLNPRHGPHHKDTKTTKTTRKSRCKLLTALLYTGSLHFWGFALRFDTKSAF